MSVGPLDTNEQPILNAVFGRFRVGDLGGAQSWMLNAAQEELTEQVD